MKNKLIIYLLLSLILIYTEKLCVQENLIKINPTYFSKNDSIEYIGFIKINIYLMIIV